MSNLFVIAHKSSDFLDTPVFHAGPDGQQEAIAIFTCRELANRYVKDAGWGTQYEVGELQPIQMLRWFAMSLEEGCDLVAINPDRKSHLEGQQQHTVQLSEPLEAFAETLRAKIMATSELSSDSAQPGSSDLAGDKIGSNG